MVSLHQAGFDNAVASLGTSLTPEQARLISRFKNEVVIAYDADEAGRKASQRAISILEKLELKVRVLTVSGAKDPDEFIKARGAEAFRNLLSDSENHIEYKLEQVRAGCDLGTAEGKVSYLKGAAEVIAALPDPASREVYSLKTAEVCGVSAAAVQDEVRQVRRRKLAIAKNRVLKENMRPMSRSQPQERSIRYKDPRSAAAEEGVIRLLCLDPAVFRGVELGEDDFSSPELWNIYSAVRRHNDEGTRLSPAALSGELSSEELSLFTSIIQDPVSASNARQALEDYIAIMRRRGEQESSLLDIQAQQLKTKSYGG